MSQQAMARLPLDGLRALMFTDARGKVVFVDSNFIKLTGRSVGTGVVGKPMHELLGIDPDAAQNLLLEIIQRGQLDRQSMQMRDAAGAVMQVACTGVATYDVRRTFIGADLALVPARPAPATAPASIAEPEAEPEVKEIAEPKLDPAIAARLKEYFTAHFRAQRELVAKVGGELLRRSMNAIVNETASRNEWPILIDGDTLFVEVSRHHDETYRGMLARIINYSVTVIGANLALREHDKVNQQLDAETVAAGETLDTISLFSDQR